MDWSDTELFEPKLYVGDTTSQEAVRVFPVQEVTLLQGNLGTYEDTDFAIHSLRGHTAEGRRVVLCNTSGMVENYTSVERQLGRALVEEGDAEVLISSGKFGREVAIGARDVGLSLSNVVVCNDMPSACRVLGNQLQPGDTVLLLGVEDADRARLVLSLEKRLARPLRAAA